MPQHDLFYNLNQTLLRLHNSLNEHGHSMQINPVLIDAVNLLNESLA